jgi:hypothetical protein
VDQLSPSITFGVPRRSFIDERHVVGAVWLPGGPPNEAITVRSLDIRYTFYPPAYPVEPATYSSCQGATSIVPDAGRKVLAHLAVPAAFGRVAAFIPRL